MNIWLFLLGLFVFATICISVFFIKETYPNTGNVTNFSQNSHFNELQITDIKQAIKRYEPISTFPYLYKTENSLERKLDYISLGKFNKNYCMALYLLNALMYKKLYYWKDLCKKNYRVWMIGPAEYLANNDINSLLQKKKDELISIISNCTAPGRDTASLACVSITQNVPSIQINPQEVQETALNLISEIERLQIENVRNDILYFLYKKQKEGTIIEKELMYIRNLNVKLNRSKITSRTSLDVYNLNYTCIENEECKPYMNVPAINLVDSKFEDYTVPGPFTIEDPVYAKYITTEKMYFSNQLKQRFFE
jgi:hypothetical protein